MFSKVYNEVVVPAGLLAALIIGAGMFSLPYLFSIAGFWLGILYLVIFSAVFAMIHLMYVDIIRRTEGAHRFVGYARMYLGRRGFWASMVTTLVGIILILLIYLVLGSYFMQVIFPVLNDISAFLIFWLFSAGAVVAGIKRIANTSLFIAGFMILMIFAIFFVGVQSFNVASFSFNPIYALFPYGAILFSFAGRPAISSIHEYMIEKKISEERVNLAIVLGSMVPAILYILFVIGILGITGGLVSEDAVSSVNLASPVLGILLAVLSLFSIWTSYILLGIEAKKILLNDLSISVFWAGIIVSFMPLLMYFGGLNSLLGLIGISGAVLLASESILVVIMWIKLAKPKVLSLLVSLGLIAVFILGAIYEVFLR